MLAVTKGSGLLQAACKDGVEVLEKLAGDHVDRPVNSFFINSSYGLAFVSWGRVRWLQYWSASSRLNRKPPTP